ncbi:MAG TPA: hypothetical protein VKA18_08695 [Alphaproteobacteria bacterium]|nr:hypothetical protein [Alphaproteobacteria bacterium]
MSHNPNQILGTFLPDGKRLTGIICTPAFQGRMVFTPDGENGRLIARINDRTVGFADPILAEGKAVRWSVSLHPCILPHGFRLDLTLENGVCFLKLAY